MNDTVENSVMNAATNYINEGFAIFPLTSNSKKPLAQSRGYKDATKEVKSFGEMYSNIPNANIAIATGTISGIVIIDIDIKNSIDGNRSFSEMCAGETLPLTKIANTPSGGVHYYFRLTKDMIIKSSAGLRPGVDVRGDGGYVVAPPSVIDGTSYEWGNENEIADIPHWLYQHLTAKSQAYINPRLQQDGGFLEGARNESLFRSSASYRAKGLSFNEARPLILEQASKCSPSFPEDEAIQCLENAFKYSPNYAYTPLGMARRLKDYYPGTLQYAPDLGWIVWCAESGCWSIDQDKAFQCVIELSEIISGEANNPDKPQDVQKKIKGFANKMQSFQGLTSILKIAQTMNEFKLDVSLLDANPLILKAENCVMDLSNGLLLAPTPKQFITKRCHITYDEKADCPKFKKFLAEIFLGDDELIGFVQRAVGYSLTGKVDEQCLFLLHGEGANGKSVFQSILRELLGDYAIAAPPQLLINKKRNSTNDLARMKGARLLIASEENRGSNWDEALVKQLTGGDRIASRMLYKEYIEFIPTAKIWIGTNHLPRINGPEHAIWRRINVIPFLYRVPPENMNTRLIEDLRNELPGILKWALVGCLEWQETGLGTCTAINEATNRYRRECDHVQDWMDAKTNGSGDTLFSDLYNSYKVFCFDSEISAISQKKFGSTLREKGVMSCRKSEGIYYQGVSLKALKTRRRRKLNPEKSPL